MADADADLFTAACEGRNDRSSCERWRVYDDSVDVQSPLMTQHVYTADMIAAWLNY